MSEKRIEAYDAGAELICRCAVRIREEDRPEVWMDGRELTEDETAALPPWDRRLLALLTEDFYEDPLFDGERIYASRGHFTLTQSAGRIPEETAEEAPEDGTAP